MAVEELGAPSRPWAPLHIVGTSHVLRWRTATKYGQVAPPQRRVDKWHGKRAQMLASDYFLQQDFANRRMPALLVVPEFRLGNRTLVADDSVSRNQMQTDSELISRPNDQTMYESAMKVLEGIQRRNPLCRFLFWSLAGREFSNRKSGKYTESGNYRHPVWNLEPTENLFGHATIRLGELMQSPETRLLFADDSMHPSWVGLELLRRLVDEPDTSALRLLQEVFAVHSKPVVRYAKPTILTGDSVWLKRLRSQAHGGLISISPEVRIVRPEHVFKYVDSDIVYVSSCEIDGQGRKPDTEWQRKFLDEMALRNPSRSVCIFFWEARARAAKNTGPNAPLAQTGVLESALHAYAVAEPSEKMRFIHRQHVESSAALHPTLQGILKVVELTGGYTGRAPLVA
ncbi:hypothetical protein ACHABX_06495 [Nesterenkonia halotolerans]|uniref:hypothetical protein n=1 Tax=Nesterenkonia halotolerans TaxID=225325 RepID=UPI003EE6F10B